MYRKQVNETIIIRAIDWAVRRAYSRHMPHHKSNMCLEVNAIIFGLFISAIAVNTNVGVLMYFILRLHLFSYRISFPFQRTIRPLQSSSFVQMVFKVVYKHKKESIRRSD